MSITSMSITSVTTAPQASATSVGLSTAGLVFLPNDTATYNGKVIALSDITNNPSQFSESQRSQAQNTLNAREAPVLATFGDPSKEGMIKYISTYTAYVHSLSPEEQNSQRYKGTVEGLQAHAPRAAGRLGPSGDDP